MTRDSIINEYFEWMFELVCDRTYKISYRKLMMHLHGIEFRYFVPNDDNRAEDGINLRNRFALEKGYSNIIHYLDGPCSVLEMMIALSVRCEEHIADDSTVGDRTGQWFWNMLVNLGLGPMTDTHFDRDFTDEIIDIFLNREYEPNGEGGLFTVDDCDYDLREVEIWYQMCWYLNGIL